MINNITFTSDKYIEFNQVCLYVKLSEGSVDGKFINNNIILKVNDYEIKLKSSFFNKC